MGVSDDFEECVSEEASVESNTLDDCTEGLSAGVGQVDKASGGRGIFIDGESGPADVIRLVIDNSPVDGRASGECGEGFGESVVGSPFPDAFMGNGGIEDIEKKRGCGPLFLYEPGGAALPHLLTSYEERRLPVPSSGLAFLKDEAVKFPPLDRFDEWLDCDDSDNRP